MISRRVAFTILLSTIFLSGCSLIPQKKAGINIVSNIPAAVTIDNEAVGQTPYDGQDLKPKKISLRLLPSDSTYTAYETSVRLSAGVQAAVDWTFGKIPEESKGIVLELENSQKKGAAELEIVTSPDNVPVTINNESKGFSPLLLDTYSAGQYTLSFQAPGYEGFSRAINLLEGKRVVVTVKLAKKPAPTPLPVATESADLTSAASTSAKATAKPTPKPTTKPKTASGSATTIAKPYVEILDTPTGFLRVRDLPSPTGKELGQLKPGQTVPYAGKTQSNWFSITYTNATGSAWVSGQYAKLVE